MAYYDRFSGDTEAYKSALAEIELRRDNLIKVAKALEPPDLAEKLAASEDGHYYVELRTVEVNHPLNPSLKLNVQPWLMCAKGKPRPDLEADPTAYISPNPEPGQYTDDGAYILGLGAIDASGNANDMGQVNFILDEGKLVFPPGLVVNFGHEHGDRMFPIEWQSADAELFLTVAEAALKAQTEVVTKDDFRQHWGRGFSHSWHYMRRYAESHPDFPLRPVDDDPEFMTGSPEAAVDWLADNYEHGPMPGFEHILKKVVTARAVEAEE